MYLQSECTVYIPDKILICSNRAAWNPWAMMIFITMESLGNDDVSSTNARRYLVGSDDVKAENARRRYGYCDVTTTGGVVNEKSPSTGRTRVLASVTRRATSSGSFPVFGFGCSQRLFERFTFALLVFTNE